MVQNILHTSFTIKYDLTKTEGAPKKIMSNKLFKEYFPDFTFTTPEDGIKKTIKYYEGII
jgi:hypothetical protein